MCSSFIFIESLQSDSTGISGIEVSSKLQQLARKQRMNTDLRRNIFYIIMTSEVSLYIAYGIPVILFGHFYHLIWESFPIQNLFFQLLSPDEVGEI